MKSCIKFAFSEYLILNRPRVKDKQELQDKGVTH